MGRIKGDTRSLDYGSSGNQDKNQKRGPNNVCHALELKHKP